MAGAGAQKVSIAPSTTRIWGICRAALRLLLLAGLLLGCDAQPSEAQPWVSASNPPSQPARTAEQDLLALQGFRDQLFDDDTWLDSWKDGTDPCLDGWLGVECNCSLVKLAEASTVKHPPPFCEGKGAKGPDLRVFKLVLSDSNRFEKITGTISPSLGHLTELWWLDLSGNQFTGTVPAALGRLKNLAFLSLRSNNLNGSLPDFLSDLESLTEVLLGDNDFDGPVPKRWCRKGKGQGNGTPPFVAALSLKGNEKVCGSLPTCFETEDELFEERFNETNLRVDGRGGVCDDTPPLCGSVGAKVAVPPFWTNGSRITFNFTGCEDMDSGIDRYYFHVLTAEENLTVVDYEPLPQPVKNVTMNDGKVVGVYEHDLTASNLKEGNRMFVTVTAVNKAGPPLHTNISSELVTVDTSPPKVPDKAVVEVACVGGDTGLDGMCLDGKGLETGPDDLPSRVLNIRWRTFEDEQTGIDAYIIQAFRLPATLPDVEEHPENLTEQREFHPDNLTMDANKSVFVNLTVRAIPSEDSYIVKVTARNMAGLTTSIESPSVLVVSGLPGGGQMSTMMLAAIVIGAVVAGASVAGGLVLFVVRGRMASFKEPDTQQKAEELKKLMNGLLDVPSETQKNRKHSREPLDHNQFEQRDVAFVVTDLEGSSAMAHYSQTVFNKILDIHNSIMRELLEQESGYEIGTEGDSFQIAFTSMVDAVVFSLNVQYRFLQHKWTSEMLRMPYCGTKLSDAGEVVFSGPRVRMGIHWAPEGTVTSRAHPETKRHFFAGPAFDVANELGNAACGGQVLMTYDAWKELQPVMKYAEFPTVEQVGLFRMTMLPTPVWLYEVKQLIARPLKRSFPDGPRGFVHMEKGSGLRIIPPPHAGGMLCFVAARLKLLHKVDSMSGMPISLAELLYGVLATQAQQFGGYIYWCQVELGHMTLSFQQTLDAVRFCLGVQMQLVHMKLPEEVLEVCGPTVFGNEGPVFHGPRVALAVHYSKEYDEVQLSGSPGGKGAGRVIYQGAGDNFTRRLCKIVNGGQTVLSASAWADVQDKIPAKSQAISLGKHVIDNVYTWPVMLMEVLPSVLAERNFDDLASRKKLEPGYRDSPPDTQDMAIVFVKAEKPEDVGHAEKSGRTEGVSDEHVRRVLTAYHEGLSLYCELVRRALPLYDGYECKEPESGKFTLAFRKLEQALCWAAHVQVEMLRLPWPAELLEMEQCRAVRHPARGTEIWRGLRIRTGMAYGDPGQRQPLKTGRADYFGNLPNLAARICSLAAPGQILFDATDRDNAGSSVKWIQPGDVGLLYFPPGADVHEEVIELRNMGRFLLRGFERDPKVVFQALPLSLVSRKFDVDLRNGALRVSETLPDHVVKRTVLARCRQWLREPLAFGGQLGVVSIKAPRKRRRRGNRKEGPGGGRVSRTDTGASMDSFQPMLANGLRSSTFGDAASLSLSTFTESPLGDHTGEGGAHLRSFANGFSPGSYLPERSALSVVSNRSRSPAPSTHDSVGRLPSMTSGGPSSVWRGLWRNESPEGSLADQRVPQQRPKRSALSLYGQGGSSHPPVGDSPGDEDSSDCSSSTGVVGEAGYSESGGRRLARRVSDASAFSEARTPGSFAREVAELYARRCHHSSPAHSQRDSPTTCADLESGDGPQASARSAPELLLTGITEKDRRDLLEFCRDSELARHGRTKSKDWILRRSARSANLSGELGENVRGGVGWGGVGEFWGLGEQGSKGVE